MPTLGLSGSTVSTSPYTTDSCDTFTGALYVAPVVSSTQTFVTSAGTPILIETNTVPSHTHYGLFCFVTDSHTTPDGTPPPPALQPPISFNASQSFVTINGIPIVMNGDPANCSASHTLSASGPAWLTITPPTP